MGTGVFFAPGLGLTARHVIDACVHHYGSQRQLGPNHYLSNFLVETFRVLDWDKNEVSYVRLDKLYGIGTSDLTIFSGWLHEEDLPRLQGVHLTYEPPNIGSIVTCFGYPNTPLPTKSEKGIHIRLKGMTTQGRVTRVFPHQRDSGSICFPSFEIVGRFDSGMSGGPVFNDDGALCGIISASSAPSIDDPDGEYISYAALLWPMLGREIAVDDVDTPIYELVDRGWIKFVTGRERFDEKSQTFDYSGVTFD